MLQLVTLCALVAAAQAGLLAAPAVHYSPASSVSSQSIVRHDQPAAKIVAAAPVYHAPAAVYHAPAPAVAYHAAPAVAYHSAPTVAYHAAPIAKVVAHQEEIVSIVIPLAFLQFTILF